MIPFILIAFIFLILAYIAAIAIWLYLKAGQKLAKKPETKVFYHSFQEAELFDQKNPILEGQSVAWKEKMQEYGQVLNTANVGLTIFSHGTFVGEDPFAIGLMLEHLFPFFKKKDAEKIKAFNRSVSSTYLYDKAYFQANYVELFEQALGQNIPALNFSWSSGNYHAARFSAVLKLIKLIYSKKEILGNKRLLLIGHSHAGQIFSLLAHLATDSKIGLALKVVLEEENILIEKELEVVRQIPLDFVLLGTPYLYPWPKTDQYKVIHLINHRNHSYLGGTPDGLLHTRDGDYIQQWGVAGSDLMASTAVERAMNKKLEPILGDTTDRFAWKDNVLSRLRVPPFGETHLIDYKDDNQLIPNGISTIFGHAIYTEYQVMLFNTKVICEALYG